MFNNYISEIIDGDENENGQGWEELTVDDGDLPSAVRQRLEYQRVGFGAATNNGGTITITAVIAPYREDGLDDELDEIDIYIPDKMEFSPIWSDSDEDISAPVTAVAEYATKNDGHAIGSVSLPDTLKSVGKCAFAFCGALKKITIPASVTEIGEYAFGYARDYTKDGECYKKIDGFVISCCPDTAGEQYAKDNGFEYKLLSDK